MFDYTGNIISKPHYLTNHPQMYSLLEALKLHNPIHVMAACNN